MENHYTETISPLIAENMKLFASATSDVGKLRNNNEDSFICQYVWNRDNILAVAIDGVGGYEGGEVASQIAREEIANYLEQNPNGDKLFLLKNAVKHANNVIFDQRQKNDKLSQMSCVLTATLIDLITKQIHMVHVGDTRLYQYHNGEIKKLSHDHSLVGYREELGELTEEEAMHHPQRNIIGRDVGSEYHEIDDNNFIEADTFPLLPNSTLLLCSDGLCDMITSVQMKYVLAQNISLDDKVNALIQSALDAGGKDNVTVVLVNYQAKEEPKAQQPVVERYMGSIDDIPEPEKPKKSKTALFVILSLVAGIAIGAVSYWALLGRDYVETIENQHDSIATLDSIENSRDSLVLELADSVQGVADYLDSNYEGLLQELDSNWTKQVAEDTTQTAEQPAEVDTAKMAKTSQETAVKTENKK